MGVGKSTLACGLVSNRRLALNLDIDELRVRLGGWQDDPEAKRVARALGFDLATSHLKAGYDVVLPQLLVRFEVIDQVASLAARVDAAFVEVVLVAPTEEIMDRIGGDSSPRHPRDHLSRGERETHVDYALQKLRRRAEIQPNALLVDIGGLNAGDALEMVRAAIDW